MAGRLLSRLLVALGGVPRASLKVVEKRLAAEIEQQSGYIDGEKKKLDGVEAGGDEWQAIQQAIHNYTGRVFGLQVALQDVREILGRK